MSNSKPSGSQTAEHLWADYYRSHSPLDRNRLYLHYQGLPGVHAVHIKKRYPPSVTFDELWSFASEGLLRAIESYRPDNLGGAAFPSYAYRKMNGAILDGLRSARFGKRSRRRQKTYLVGSMWVFRQRRDESDHFREVETDDLFRILACSLDRTERLIMTLRYRRGLSNEEIGRVIGVSGERIRQITVRSNLEEIIRRVVA
ncbi:MAG: sigma-70 family RNA polymerase sigma factor [Candidatus Vogelbacteria bacterium]|nr:sigma-70 family RNA polymerase sigma factor [Candidatus Vogelbacteria bacterium]